MTPTPESFGKPSVAEIRTTDAPRPIQDAVWPAAEIIAAGAFPGLLLPGNADLLDVLAVNLLL